MSDLINWKNIPPFSHSVANGISHAYTLHKFGVNLDIDAGTETVWDAGGLYPYQTTAQALEIVSSDANDTSAGTGAQTVTIQGLDANYDLQEETVSLNGITAVDLANTYLRVFRLYVATAGTGEANAGTITLQLDGAGATQGTIAVGINQSQMAVYTVPRNHTFFCTFFGGESTAGAAGNTMSIFLKQRPTGGVFRPVENVLIRVGGSSAVGTRFDPPIAFPEKTDIKVDGLSDAANLNANASFHGIVYRNK